jgi:hypothetical protein
LVSVFGEYIFFSGVCIEVVLRQANGSLTRGKIGHGPHQHYGISISRDVKLDIGMQSL